MDHSDYDFPLYSLQLIPIGTAARTEKEYFITVPPGRLTIRPALLKRGQEINTEACDQAIGEALAYHGQNVPGFDLYGMGSEWAGNLRYWGGRMKGQEAQRMQLLCEGQLGTRERRALCAEARRLWSRLTLSSQLAGIKGSVIRGRAPFGILALCEALEQAAERARDNAEVLSRNGFPAQDLQRLKQVIAALLPARKQDLERQGAHRDQSGALCVIRGAIVGDLGRLCRVAPQVLPPQASGGLRMRRLFPSHPRRPDRSPIGSSESTGIQGGP